MFGVIVVDAGRNRSTCLGCDAYIHDHFLGYHHNYALFYQLLNSNVFTHCMLSFKRETSRQNYGLRVLLSSYIKIPKILCCNFLYFILFCVFARPISQNLYYLIYLNNEEGLTTPLTRWFASFCCLCAGVVS